jgi:hypothetical protein
MAMDRIACLLCVLQWDHQLMIARIHSSLCRRSYIVWIDTGARNTTRASLLGCSISNKCREKRDADLIH